MNKIKNNKIYVKYTESDEYESLDLNSSFVRPLLSDSSSEEFFDDDDDDDVRFKPKRKKRKFNICKLPKLGEGSSFIFF